MSTPPVRIGIIGTGFGQSAQIPAFRATPGAEVVAVCSGRQERADAAAREHGIAHAFSDYNEMLQSVPLDLVSIVTPVYLHYPMVRAALESGCHVLCEKPMALNAAESRELWQQAAATGKTHLINHELRFNPTRMKIAELLRTGYIGQVYTIQLTTVSGFRADPNRAWDWWSQKRLGGGALGANGSHQIDLLRWWLGEITAVAGQLHTYVQRRPDPQGALRAVDADDQCAFWCEFTVGARANVHIVNVARHATGSRLEIHGSEGSLTLDGDDRLWGLRAGEKQPTELTAPDPAAAIPGIGANVWARSCVHLARALVTAIQGKRAPARGATFFDGYRCQQVIDAVRQSSDERKWVELPAP